MLFYMVTPVWDEFYLGFYANIAEIRKKFKKGLPNPPLNFLILWQTRQKYFTQHILDRQLLNYTAENKKTRFHPTAVQNKISQMM